MTVVAGVSEYVRKLTGGLGLPGWQRAAANERDRGVLCFAMLISDDVSSCIVKYRVRLKILCA